MIRLNIHEVKAHLSKYLAKLEEGETILLCRRNKPIAEIRPVSAKRKKPRPIGLDEGKIKLGPVAPRTPGRAPEAAHVRVRCA